MITMRKLFVCLLSLLLLVTLLSGCSTVVIDTERYQVIRNGGYHYLTFNDEGFINELKWDEPYYRTYISFDSLEDLLSTFRNGAFSDKEYYIINYVEALDNANKEIFDIGNLVEPIVPSPLLYEFEEIQWRNERLLYIGNIDGLGCTFYIYPADQSAEHALDVKKLPQYNSDRYNSSVEYDSESNATVYYFQAKSPPYETYKYVSYTIHTGSKSMVVQERYEEYHDGDTVPTEVLFSWVECGKYCYAVLYPNERPSVEWLSQFGIQKYEG